MLWCVGVNILVSDPEVLQFESCAQEFGSMNTRNVIVMIFLSLFDGLASLAWGWEKDIKFLEFTSYLLFMMFYQSEVLRL